MATSASVSQDADRTPTSPRIARHLGVRIDLDARDRKVRAIGSAACRRAVRRQAVPRGSRRQAPPSARPRSGDRFRSPGANRAPCRHCRRQPVPKSLLLGTHARGARSVSRRRDSLRARSTELRPPKPAASGTRSAARRGRAENDASAGSLSELQVTHAGRPVDPSTRPRPTRRWADGVSGPQRRPK